MIKELNPSKRTLMGPGPSDVHPNVLKSMATPLLGHLDPEFLSIMNETMDLIRNVFNTKNQLTIPISGTGSAGMETIFVNLVEPGDKVIIGVNGLFGERMADVAERAGADVIRVENEWGKIIEPAQIEAVLKQHENVKLVAVVHAETSTGVMQPLKEIGEMVKGYKSLFVVDAVTSTGGIPINMDENQIDAIYSGTQKCISAPPGLAPVSFSQEAVDVIMNRKSKVQSWYLDLTMLANYWGKERFYHHTAPISMVYSLHEALRLIHQEGYEEVYKRHEINGRALQAGLEAMGLTLFAQEGYRLPMLTSVKVPLGVEDLEVRKTLLNRYGIEIGGGLGPIKGQIWRIGLMGYSSKRTNVIHFLAALEQILTELNGEIVKGKAIQEAEKYLNQNS